MSYLKTVLNRPLSVILIILSVIIFGIMSIGGMQMEYFPDLNMPMEVVVITYPGADADSVERLVVEPIEDIGKNLTGIDSIESASYENYGMIQFTYGYETDLDDAYMELKAALDNMAGDLPDECDPPKIMEVGINNDATIAIAAKSKDGNDILDYINDTVVPSLESLGGVAEVKVNGSREKYAKIVLDEDKMKQYGLTINQIASDVASADFDMPVGTLKFGTQEIAANAYSDIDWHTTLKKVAIRTNKGALITLSDVVNTINMFEDDPDTISRFNGQDSVIINVTKKSTAETIGVCNAVEKKIKSLENDSVEYEVINSSADDIMDTLTEVLKTLVEGVLITMAVLLVFLGDWKASLIVGSSMPLSLFIAAMVLKLMKMPFDLMTGTGMIIAIGMLVDNSIVVLESCFRAQEEQRAAGEKWDFKKSALNGTSAMVFSVLGSTLTTVVVYAPIAMATGMSGQMNRPLCYSIIFTMTASLINSVTVVPLLFTLIKPKSRTELKINRLLDVLRDAYKVIIPKFLKRPVIPVIVAIALLFAAGGLFTTLNLDIFPPNYDGSIKVEAEFRSGTKLSVMDERIKNIEQALVSDDNFESVELTIESTGVTMTAYSSAKSKRTSEENVELYTEKFKNITDMDLNITPTGVTTGLASLMSEGNAKTITLESGDMAALEEGSKLIEEKLNSVPGVIKVQNKATARKTNARFHIDQQAAKNAGFQPSSVASQIYSMLNGVKATTIEDENMDKIDVKIKYPDDEYNDPRVLLNQAIVNSDGKSIALKDICDIEYTEIPQEIKRADDKFIVEVKAVVNSRQKYRASAAVGAAAKEVELPAGVELSQSSTDKRLGEEMGSMGNSLIIAILLVFLVMAIQFESVRYSVMVMLCIPFSMIGSFGFMFLLGEPISMMAMMGILMLVGMVVNNGILLVDGVNELKKEMPLNEALIESGLTRLRPILMTTLTTVLSMLPLLISGNSGMNMMHGMGVVIVGGLIASTILAMFLMPPFYILISGKKK